MKEPLKAEELRIIIDEENLETIFPGAMKETIIGQPRAIEALETGLKIKSSGFNIYVSGPSGTGKQTAVKRFLAEIAEKANAPNDWCYINNFKDPYRPRKISLPTGLAQEFKRDMRNFVTEAQNIIRAAFESDEFAQRKKIIMDKMKNKKEKEIVTLNEEAKKENLVIRLSPVGITTVPIKNGKPITEKQSELLTENERGKLREKHKKMEEKLEYFIQQIRKIEKEAENALKDLEKSTVLFAIGGIIKELMEKYDLHEITNYLEEVKDDICENLAAFLGDEPKMPILPREMEKPAVLTKYDVNVLVDNAEAKGAPIVIEQNPTFSNLFGKIEKETQWGTLVTNFTLIKDGSVHRANGGYLVLTARDVIMNPFAWEGLKRCLKNKEVEIEEPMDKLGLFSAKTLRPEPIPLDLKVILLDDPFVYQLLYNFDKDFRELFKIKADFDTTMEFSEENIRHYQSFIRRIENEEKLIPFSRDGMAEVLHYGCRLAEDQNKLSTHFGKIADVLRESSFYASAGNAKEVSGSHILHTIEKNHYRSNLIQEKIQEMMKNEVLAIETDGKKIGQVNGITVADLGDIAFGFPVKITANSSIGKDGIVDIEREVKLGGRIHSKGVMVLTGYLKDKYGKNNLITLSSSLVFEQSYSEIEGDSASSAELYALLSSLASLPVHQGIAVTGSVNQKGEVQAVGGINEKIEGFYETCKLKGITGNQGVIIPAINKNNLLLKEEVVNAVSENKFRIWGVNTIDEGIEILTSVAAGKETEDGKFETGSVKYLVSQRFQKMLDKMKRFAALTKDQEKATVLTDDLVKLNKT